MKKLVKYLGLLILVGLLTTGCVKMDLQMKIHEDKSMDIQIVEAVKEEVLKQYGQTEMLSKEDQSKLKEDGYQTEKYQEEGMKGYKLVKHIKNIDKVSSEKKVESNLGLTTSEDDNETMLFQVEKGFFKNTYHANFVSSDSKNITNQLNKTNTESLIKPEQKSDTTDGVTILDEEDSSSNNFSELKDFDYSSMLAGMDMKLKVELPYKALSNNATDMSDDGKILTWDFMKQQEEAMTFSFELYNLHNIYNLIGILIMIILSIVLMVGVIRRKRKTVSSI